MPKSDKKGKQPKGKAAAAQSDDDFDNMLAEFRTADLNAPSGAITTTSIPSSSTTAPAPTALEDTVSEQALLSAVVRGDISQLQRWARQGLRVRNGEPLCHAAAHGKVDAARCLVKELGADVNQADKQGYTSLTLATCQNNFEMMNCLVKDLGADVNLADTNSYTPLFYSVVGSGADLDVMRYLVNELGADVNQVNAEGLTPIYRAVQAGCLPSVQCLVGELGADVNLAAPDDSTPLILATVKMHQKIIKYLIKQGADTQVRRGQDAAAHLSKYYDAPAEQTAYLEAKTHCTNPNCRGNGIKKCTGCKEARYCGEPCQLAHWPAHKAECKEAAVLKAAETK